MRHTRVNTEEKYDNENSRQGSTTSDTFVIWESVFELQDDKDDSVLSIKGEWNE